MSGQIQEAHHFKLTCEILSINCARTMWYTACTDCKKKVNPADAVGGGDYGQEGENKRTQWYCERCAKHFDECAYTYNFSMRIGDESDAIYVQVLGEYPGNEIIGMSAQ